ncbi:aldehyde dehydrogenase family protein [Bdellovibrio reynosensis]|uniref:Aldehyde dehydrogenase family protein n=1 Tax=Bdellovibrio reynosensis TaxID=2835041 RepID=A0ABY4C4J8_9BACT|nr:aldehyde dehydrogenase family protein [Bdellovibrio reynosensis]UOE99885.1 aldehyde dehydrogenase family protein [Bdellovibrio reynosensis]
MEILNYIHSEFAPALNATSFTKLSPFDGSLLAQVSNSDAMDVIKAIQAAKKAQIAWKELAAPERANYLLKIAEHLEQKASEIAYQEALHQGLAQSFSRSNNVDVAVKNLRLVAAEVLDPLPKNVLPSPVGVVGIITSWCLSLRLVTERLAPALAAGNTVIIKVSEHSPITAKVLADAINAANLPPGIVNILNGTSDVGHILASHPGIRAISAAGKTSTMEAIAKASVSQLKKLQLSGSAKNACLILGDTDYKNLLPQILYPFLMGQSQLCWNISRVFVLENQAKDFTALVKNYFETLQPLKDPRGQEMWTPLISSAASESIDEKIQSGRQEHGKILVGAQKETSSGNFYRPTVMLDLSNCSVLQQDELAGPLLLITPVKYQHEMLKWANTAYLGHSAVVWGPEEKLMKPAASLECAHVFLNGWLDAEPLTIFGHKQSSFGNPDMSWAGSFYSDVKKLTAL